MESSSLKNLMNFLIPNNRPKIKLYVFLITIIFLLPITYSFLGTEKVVKYERSPSKELYFSIMLWNKTDIDKLTLNNIDHLVFQLTNSITKNVKRRTFELVVYVYYKNNTSEIFKLESPSQIGTGRRLVDIPFEKKDHKMGNFVMSITDFQYITTIAPSYKYLRFDPFENTDSKFDDYVSYKVEPVDANGVGIEVMDTATLVKRVPTKTIDPSPPAQ